MLQLSNRASLPNFGRIVRWQKWRFCSLSPSDNLLVSICPIHHTPLSAFSNYTRPPKIMASSTRISYASESAAVENTKWASLLLPKIHWVQRDDSTSPSAWLVTTLVVVLSLLILEQYVYRSKKQHLPGPTWTIPVIGKFFDSITPSMEKYKKSWSTPLSVASVFQM